MHNSTLRPPYIYVVPVLTKKSDNIHKITKIMYKYKFPSICMCNIPIS